MENIEKEQVVKNTTDTQMEDIEKQKRIASCTSVIQEALKEYKCDLDVSVILRAGQVMPRVSIIPIELLEK